MKVNIHGKNKFVVKPALREYIEKQIIPIGEMFRLADSVTANVVCKEDGDAKIVEVTIPTKYLIMRAEAEAEEEEKVREARKSKNIITILCYKFF